MILSSITKIKLVLCNPIAELAGTSETARLLLQIAHDGFVEKTVVCDLRTQLRIFDTNMKRPHEVCRFPHDGFNSSNTYTLSAQTTKGHVRCVTNNRLVYFRTNIEIFEAVQSYRKQPRLHSLRIVASARI